MPTFFDDLQNYLQNAGFKHVFCDTLLDEPHDCIALFLWAHTTPAINDGTGVRHIQVQCRSRNPLDAYRAAHAVTALLDSGQDETVIHLTPERWCIARPTKLPRKLSVDASNRTVYYCEFALWGDNAM